MILLGTYFFLRNNASNTREDYRDVVRQHVTFIGHGSFEDWDLIEDFEHATQYEHGIMSTTRKRLGHVLASGTGQISIQT